MGADVFSYDGVSRLTHGTASQGQVGESHQYDAFGNHVRAFTSNVGSRSIPTDPATNRLLGTPERPVAHDDRGNVTGWGSAVYEIDAFDMLVRHDDGSIGLSYVYTADDERLMTIDNAAPNETWTLRDLDGKLLRRFFRDGVGDPGDITWQKDTIHRQGQVLATEDGAGRRDAHLDHLGTIRLWTGSSGSSPTHHTYHAFGEEVMDVQDGQVLRFTGHERDIYRSEACPHDDVEVIDNETITTGQRRVGCDEVTSDNTTIATTQEVRFVAGDRIALSEFTVEAGSTFVVELDGFLNSDLQDLDYMHARYASPGLGRFLSVDPGNSSLLGQPQSWNRYAYATNNPIRFVDPDGEFAVIPFGVGIAIAVGAGLISGSDAANAPTSASDELVESGGAATSLKGGGLAAAVAAAVDGFLSALGLGEADAGSFSDSFERGAKEKENISRQAGGEGEARRQFEAMTEPGSREVKGEVEIGTDRETGNRLVLRKESSDPLAEMTISEQTETRPGRMKERRKIRFDPLERPERE